MKKTSIAAAMTWTLLLAGCSDPKEASNENFELAAQRLLDATHQKPGWRGDYCFMIDVRAEEGAQSFQLVLETNDRNRDEATQRFHDSAAWKMAVAMTERGALAMEEATEETARGFTPRGYQKVTYTFTPTPISAPHFQLRRTGEPFFGYRYKPQFCAGRAAVVEVDGYTEPADLMGKRVSEANVVLRATELPEWMKVAPINEANDQIKRANQESYTQRIVMVLRNDGWEVMQ